MTAPSRSLEKRLAIEQRAAELYLHARSTDSDEAWEEAYRWVELDPSHGVAFAKAEASWELAARLREVAPPVGPEAVAGPAGRFEALFEGRGSTVLLVAAVAGLLLTIGIQRWVSVERYRTQVGEERLVQLAERAATVYLNTDTAIEVSANEGRRNVRLLHGEARFSVVADAKQPVIIETGTATIRSWGADFNVRLRPELAEVTVVRGAIQLQDGASPLTRLAAGTGAVIRGQSIAATALTPQQIAQRTAWQDGVVQFNNVTLDQAIEEFNRYRTAHILIGEPELAALRIDGTFGADGSDRFLAMLEKSHGIRLVPSADRSIILLPSESK